MSTEEQLQTKAKEVQANDPADRRAFLAVGAVVARLHSQLTQCDVVTYLWDGQAADPEHGPLLHIDMSRRVSAPNIEYEDALYDGFGALKGGGTMAPGEPASKGIIATSIGPDWPTGGFAGALYVLIDEYRKKRNYIEHHGTTWPPNPGVGEADRYAMVPQFVNIRYSKDVRYIGFAARLAASIAPTADSCDVEIWNPRTKSYWATNLKFVSLDTTVPEDILSTIQAQKIAPVVRPGLSISAPTNVSVFIKDTYAAELVYSGDINKTDGLASPKLPFWMG